MLPLSNLLARFKNLTNTERVRKELICEVLKEFKIPLLHTQVSFSKNTVFIKAPPLIKTEVALKKSDILKKITTNTGLRHIQDIF